jgi:hypothetical protein
VRKAGRARGCERGSSHPSQRREGWGTRGFGRAKGYRDLSTARRTVRVSVASVEMTFFLLDALTLGQRRNQLYQRRNQLYQRENCARNQGGEKRKAGRARGCERGSSHPSQGREGWGTRDFGRAKGYRDLSTTRRTVGLSVASVEMTFFLLDALTLGHRGNRSSSAATARAEGRGSESGRLVRVIWVIRGPASRPWFGPGCGWRCPRWRWPRPWWERRLVRRRSWPRPGHP